MTDSDHDSNMDFEIELNKTAGDKRVLTFGAQPLFREATAQDISQHHDHGHKSGLVEPHRLDEDNDAISWWNLYKAGKIDFGNPQDYSTEVHVKSPEDRVIVTIPSFDKYQPKEYPTIEIAPVVL